MFRPAKIYHVTSFLRKDYIKKIVTPLHEAGVCELKESDIKLDSEYSYENVREVEETYARLKFVQETLDKYKEIPQPEKFIKALFKKGKKKKQKAENTKIKISPRLTKKIVEAVQKLLDKIEPSIKSYLNELSEKKKKIEQNNFLISNLYLLPDSKTSVFKSTENIKVHLGLIEKNSFKIIEKKLKDIAVIGLRLLEKEQSLLTVFTYSENNAKVEKVLHEIGFEVLTVPFEDKKPIYIISDLKKQNDSLKSKIREIEENLKNLQKENKEKNKVLIEELENTKEKVDALKNIRSSNSFSILEAWVPKASMHEFHMIMKEHVKDYYAEIEESKDAPTIYKNPSLIRPYEMITNLYSPPVYKGFDPTPLLAVFFTIFFGFMLDDFFYGLILAVAGFIALKKLSKNNQSVRDISVFILILGISTMFWGVVFGAYFGNFFQEFGINLPMLIDSMKQVMITLGIAVGLGAIHLIVGLLAGFYDNIANRKFKDAFYLQGVWLFFMAGAIFIILQSINIGLSLIGIAVVMQIVFTFITSGAVSAILSIFSFTGFLGDLFSYARLMALGIGTSGISLAVNFMTFLVASMIPYIGIPIAIIIFIVGHAFNMAMNGLGAFIHTTRLHFLEFFTKFYDGGGRLYKPFKAKRKHTEIGG